MSMVELLGDKKTRIKVMAAILAAGHAQNTNPAHVAWWAVDLAQLIEKNVDERVRDDD